jgi:phosphatidylserine/phosphatidylglycerophosphate/cardiolipin synthase-like enzyme
MVVIRHAHRPIDDVAFIGGIDLDHGSRDDADHQGDRQSVGADQFFGPNPAYHDLQLELRGPVVSEAEEVFRERWSNPAAVSRLPWHVIPDRIHGLRRTHSPLPPALPDPPAAGSCAVQLLRTYPRRRPAYPYAPLGERSIALDNENPFYLEAAMMGHAEALGMVREAGGDRVQVLDVENHQGLPVYVHSKCIIDDVWAAVGSNNFNMRSWTHDSELTAAVLDAERDPREPTDPAGLGDGARRFARELRLSILREHLDMDRDDDLIDPDSTAEIVRKSAAELDAWHEGRCKGPRPAGRMRAHVSSPEGRLPARHSWLTAPVYRSFLDPDGRPLGMRLRRTY